MKALMISAIRKAETWLRVVGNQDAECSFCGTCASVCPVDCFDVLPGEQPWTLRASVGSSCIEGKGVSCRMCEDACEHRAIGFEPRIGGGSSMAISQKNCTGCGACVLACPVRAISVGEAAPNTKEAAS
jgi:ferredoxin-type protein NapF